MGADPDLTLYETLYRLLGEKAHAALGGWMFPFEAQFKQVKNLSGGERARLALLSLSLQQASLLVLDEPTNHLDLETVEALEEALLAYPGTLLLVSHDLFFLDQLATRTWHLADGQFADYPAPPSEYLKRRKAMVAPSKVEGRGPEVAGPTPDSRTVSKVKGRWRLEREKERLETLIGALELQLQTLHARAAQPGVHHREYAQITEEQQSLEAGLSQAFEQWAEVSGQLDTG
jgi:ATP-binding cassette subfamily F protein 3